MTLFLIALGTEAAPSLRNAAMRHGVLIGAATNDIQLRRFMSEPQYKDIARQQFSVTMSEKSCAVRFLTFTAPTHQPLHCCALLVCALQMASIHPKMNSYNFDGCDTVFQAAKEAAQKVRSQIVTPQVPPFTTNRQ